MTLGSDVSGMTATAASAAAKGLSIVVPVYNEAAGLAALHQRICDLAKTLRQRYRLACEVVYVDDGSADTTLSIARSLPADAVDVQVVSLSRNFGKEAALMAGLDHARLGAVMFMDGAAHPWRDHLQHRAPARSLDRRGDLVLGGAAALCEPARRDPRRRRLPVRPLDPVGGLDHRQAGARLSLAGDRPDDHRRCAAH